MKYIRPEIRTSLTNNIKKGQIFSMPSQTIQGETLTIQQLFKRAAQQGNFVLEDQPSMYIDVPNIEDIDNMYRQGHDIIDLKAFSERISDLNAKVQAHQAKQQKEAQTASKEAERKAIIKAHNDEQNDEKGDKKSDKTSA